MARRFIEVIEVDELQFPGRAVRARVRLRPLGEVDVVSVYAKDGIGIQGVNEELYDSMVCSLAEGGRPFVIAGDHNMPPSQLAGFLEDRELHIRTLVPAEPTCITKDASSTIDYVVVHGLLAGAASGAEVLHGFNLSPHRPVRVELQLGELAREVPVWRRAECGSARPVFGPMTDPERHVDEAQVLLADVREFMQEAGLGDALPGSLLRASSAWAGRRWGALALNELGLTAGATVTVGQCLEPKQMPRCKLLPTSRKSSTARPSTFSSCVAARSGGCCGRGPSLGVLGKAASCTSSASRRFYGMQPASTGICWLPRCGWCAKPLGDGSRSQRGAAAHSPRGARLSAQQRKAGGEPQLRVEGVRRAHGTVISAV